MSSSPNTNGSTPGKQVEGFFSRILSVLFGGNDPEREKRRRLKAINKQLSRSRYRFYKERGGEMLPAWAKLLHDTYRVVGPAGVLLQNAESSEGLRTLVVDRLLTEEQRHAASLLDPTSIRKRADEIEVKQLAAEVKGAMASLVNGFDTNRTREINGLYNQVLAFISFVMYDFHFALKKFDSRLPEQDFTYKPKFEAIRGEYAMSDIEDFLDVVLPLTQGVDWDGVFDTLRDYRQMEVIDRAAWRRAYGSIEAVIRSEVLVMVLRLTKGVPDYQPAPSVTEERIVEPYVNAIKTRTESVMQKIATERRDNRVNSLLQKVFGTIDVSRMRNYNDSANMVFNKRGLAGYTETRPLEYLKAFLLDYFKRDVRELHDALVVRGQWTSAAASQQMSEAYHAVLEISEQLVKFDDELAEDGQLGQKVRKAIGRIVDRDKSTTRPLAELLDAINQRAKSFVSEAAHQLIAVGRSLKLVLEDYGKEKRELIMNWREVENVMDRPIGEAMDTTYRRMYHFIQLMQIYAKAK